MRHGQGFGLVLQDWLRLAAAAPVGGSDPAPGFGQYRPMFAYTPADLLEAGGADRRDLLAMLARLATQMHVGALRLSGRNGSLPAGYTYLGQFAVHDLVNSAGLRATADQTRARRQFGNIQTPALDLASLYGGGPAGSPAFFEPTEETEHRSRFRLGWMRDRHGNPARQEDIPRIALGPETGVAVPDGRYDPLLADNRNADNLILSQLAVVLMKAHNRLSDRAHAHAATGGARHRMFGRPFEAARAVLTSAYQRILRHDFLPRVLPPQAVARLDQPRARDQIGLEAALAVLRFGHALVQQDYDFNASHASAGPSGPARLERLMDFFGMRPSRDLPVDDSWVIDWGLFFDMAPARPPGFNLARPLGPVLADTLRRHAATRIAAPPDLPELRGHLLGLGWRTMAKGLMAKLPTGQAVAREMASARRIASGDILTRADLERILRAGRTAGCIGEKCLTDADIAYFAQHTPLFFYILAEAQQTGGDRLGPVGGTILAETFAGSLADTGVAEESSLHAAADALWHELFPAAALPATMPELIAFATTR